MISILITTQKYTKLPTPVRSNINLFISFNLMKFDWKKIQDEIIFIDADTFENIHKFIFDNDDPSNFILYNIDTNEFYKKFDKILI